MTIEEIGNYIKRCRASVYKLIHDGAIPAKKSGTRTLAARVDVEAYMQSLPPWKPARQR